jgi:hypothetical protein
MAPASLSSLARSVFDPLSAEAEDDDPARRADRAVEHGRRAQASGIAAAWATLTLLRVMAAWPAEVEL